MQRLLTGDGRNPCPGPAQCRGSPTSVAIKPSGSLRCLLPALHLSCRLFQTLLLAKSQVYGLEGKRIHSSIIGPQQSRPAGHVRCPLSVRDTTVSCSRIWLQLRRGAATQRLFLKAGAFSKKKKQKHKCVALGSKVCLDNRQSLLLYNLIAGGITLKLVALKHLYPIQRPYVRGTGNWSGHLFILIAIPITGGLSPSRSEELTKDQI